MPSTQPSSATTDEQMTPEQRKTRRQSTGWNRNDRNDAPHNAPQQ